MPRRRGEPDPEDVLTWHESDEGLGFTVAEVALAESRDNVALERAARACAAEIEAQVGYAYRLDRPVSAAWWTDWGGFDLQVEIRLAAARARPGGDGLSERALGRALERDWDDFTEAELTLGFRRWFAALPAAARTCFLRDLRSWQARARAWPETPKPGGAKGVRPPAPRPPRDRRKLG